MLTNTYVVTLVFIITIENNFSLTLNVSYHLYIIMTKFWWQNKHSIAAFTCNTNACTYVCDLCTYNSFTAITVVRSNNQLWQWLGNHFKHSSCILSANVPILKSTCTYEVIYWDNQCYSDVYVFPRDASFRHIYPVYFHWLLCL